MTDRTELANRLREHANQSKSLADWVRELGVSDSARTAKHHEAKAADLTAAADMIEREAAVPVEPEPMTPNDINIAAGAELAALLDHIYEHSTASEGVMPLAVAFARVIETEVLRRVKEMDNG